MRSEKSGASSAACAASLIRDRRRSSSNGSVVSKLAVAVEERVSAKVGAILLWPLLALAVFSLLLWRWTDDLRLYGWVQFFPCIALPAAK